MSALVVMERLAIVRAARADKRVVGCIVTAGSWKTGWWMWEFDCGEGMLSRVELALFKCQSLLLRIFWEAICVHLYILTFGLEYRQTHVQFSVVRAEEKRFL